jgi:CheY-like chemotaxis protein
MSNGNSESCVLHSPADAARLLLVEDNLINQKVATLMLKHMGYRADIANNGCEAVNLLDRNTYDLVLMDCLMPEMDGQGAHHCHDRQCLC